VCGLEKIFSPVVVNAMADTEVETITSKPLSAKCQRGLLENRIQKLQVGHKIFRGVMGSGSCFIDGKYRIRIYNKLTICVSSTMCLILTW
jgi:hypothetical protein